MKEKKTVNRVIFIFLFFMVGGCNGFNEKKRNLKKVEEKNYNILLKTEVIQKNEEVTYPYYATPLTYQLNIYEQPDETSQKLGYIRWGNSIKVSPPIKKERRCNWHKLITDGYICAGKKVKISNKPYKTRLLPLPPDLSSPLPYNYVLVREDLTPLYRWIPTPKDIEKEREEEKKLQQLEQQKAQVESSGNDIPLAQTSNEASLNTQIQENETTIEPLQKGKENSEEETKGNGIVATRLNRGFYLSINREEKKRGVSLYQTIKGFYVETSKTFPLKHREFPLGIDLKKEGISLPLAIVTKSKGYLKVAKGEKKIGIFNLTKIERFTKYPLLARLTLGENNYWIIEGGSIINEREIALAIPVTPPQPLINAKKWIEVNLTQQTLIAYEGRIPVFVTVVSTGKETKEEYKTPEGIFYIQSKHVTSTMDDVPVDDRPYLIEDVPWTIYFYLNLALHGAFWHSSFGHPRSHGCINLSPPDARWLFYWSEPTLKEGWHGIYTNNKIKGTPVFIHR